MTIQVIIVSEKFSDFFSDDTKDATKDATQDVTKQVSPTGGDSTGGGDGINKGETHDTDGKVPFRLSKICFSQRRLLNCSFDS